MKECVYCGRVFEPRHSLHKYCSPLCKQYEWNKRHPDAVKRKQKKWREKNREKLKEYGRIHTQRRMERYRLDEDYRRRYLEKRKLHLEKIRLEIIRGLGGRCRRCGTSDTRVLQVHHSSLKDTPRGWASRIYALRYQLNEGKDNLELLCANCHIIRHIECNV